LSRKLCRLNGLTFIRKSAQQKRSVTFAQYILNKNLHDVKSREAKSKLVHLAFNTSLIVSYSRPFHWSNEGEGFRVRLKEAVGDILDADQRALHTKVLIKRDRAFAHSDAIAHEFEGLDYSGPTVLIYKSAFQPLTKDETRMLRGMVRKWISYVEESKLF